MIRLIPFAYMSSLSEPVLTIDAATLRWTNAGRRPTVRCAASTHFTLVRPRPLGETIGAILALLDQCRPRPLRPNRTHHLSRRSTAGPHRTIITVNRTMELLKVTRPAKKNFFSRV